MNNLKLKPLKLSPKQQYILNKLPKNKQNVYTASFYGFYQNRIHEVSETWPFMDTLFDRTGRPDRIYNMFKEKIKKDYNATTFKKPTIAKDDWVGIEIECFLPKDSFEENGGCDGECRSECECLDYSCGSCGHDLDEPHGECECECTCSTGYLGSVAESIALKRIKGVQVVNDGSLNADDDELFGVEIKVLTQVGDMSNLKKLCDWLDENNAYVNKTCGLHVHLDVKNLDGETRDLFYTNLENLIPFLSLMIPSSRRESSYCKPQASYSDRYSAVNGAAISKHNTIEVRLHSGTTNFEKISNWCVLLQEIKNNAMSGCEIVIESTNKYKMVENMLNLLSLPYSVSYYILSRIIKFNPTLFRKKEFKDMKLVDYADHEEETCEDAA